MAVSIWDTRHDKSPTRKVPTLPITKDVKVTPVFQYQVDRKIKKIHQCQFFFYSIIAFSDSYATVLCEKRSQLNIYTRTTHSNANLVIINVNKVVYVLGL